MSPLSLSSPPFAHYSICSACPYMLTPVECGHTFCATCTLKWFFSRLHSGCGAWHESVDCPLCRALLVITPEEPPRTTALIPFAPNRLADGSLRNILDKLAKLAPLQDMVEAATEEGCGCPVACASTVADPSPSLTGWKAWTVGGMLRNDWIERDRSVVFLCSTNFAC